MARYAYHQLDSNHKAIVEALEAGGCSVEPLGRPVDLVVGKNGRTYLVEVKTAKGKLRPSQEKFLAGWKGHAAVLRSIEDVQQFLREL